MNNGRSFNELIDKLDSTRTNDSKVELQLKVKSINNRSNSNDQRKEVNKDYNSFSKLKRALT